MPRARKRRAKGTANISPPETAENCLLKDYDDNITKTLATAEDFVVNNPPSLMGMLYGDLPPSVVWKVLYLVNRQISSEEECTLLCLLTDYLAGECVDLGLLNPGHKYNTQTHVLLEEVANAWNNVLQQPRVFKDDKLLKSLLSNLKKSVSSFTVFGFAHYFSRTLDIVSKHELNQTIVPFFTYPMVPKNYSIPEYKVKRILSAGRIPRQDVYKSYQDTVCKPVPQTHKKSRWDSSDIEWVPSDDDMDSSFCNSEFEGKDSDPASDEDSSLNSVSEKLITNIKEPLKDVSNYNSPVKPSKKGQKTHRNCLGELEDQGKKAAFEHKENYISWKDQDHYDFGYSSPPKDKQSVNSMRDTYSDYSDYSVSPINWKRCEDSPPRSRKEDARANERKAMRDLYSDYSDYSLSPIIRKRCEDSPPRSRKDDGRENKRKLKKALRDLYVDESDYSVSPTVKKRYEDSPPRYRNDDFRGKDKLKTSLRDLYVDESSYSLSPIVKKRYENSPARCIEKDIGQKDKKEKRKQRDNNLVSYRKDIFSAKNKKLKTSEDPKEENFSSDSAHRRKEPCERWTNMSGRKEKSNNAMETWGELYHDENIYSHPAKPNERNKGIPLKLKKLSGSTHHKSADAEKQQSRAKMMKAFSDDSNSLPDLDDQSVPTDNKQCWKDSMDNGQEVEEDDYYARRVGFRSFNDTASDVESLCSSEYNGGEASVKHLISCEDDEFSILEKSRFVMDKKQKHDTDYKRNIQEDKSVSGKTFRMCHETKAKSKENLRENSEFLNDDMSCSSQATKQKKRKDCKEDVYGSPAKRSRLISSPRSRGLENEVIKKSLCDESFHCATPYRTPEIAKPNNRDVGREILPSSPQNPGKTPSKSRNQDIRKFFQGCC